MGSEFEESGPSPETGENERSSRPDRPMRAKIRVGPAGRVVIPAAMRSAMGVKEGDVLIAELGDGELKLITVQVAVKKAQNIVRRYVPEGVSLVDEFLAERRRMWGEE